MLEEGEREKVSQSAGTTIDKEEREKARLTSSAPSSIPYCERERCQNIVR